MVSKSALQDDLSPKMVKFPQTSRNRTIWGNNRLEIASNPPKIFQIRYFWGKWVKNRLKIPLNYSILSHLGEFSQNLDLQGRKVVINIEGE